MRRGCGGGLLFEISLDISSTETDESQYTQVYHHSGDLDAHEIEIKHEEWHYRDRKRKTQRNTLQDIDFTIREKTLRNPVSWEKQKSDRSHDDANNLDGSLMTSIQSQEYSQYCHDDDSCDDRIFGVIHSASGIN